MEYISNGNSVIKNLDKNPIDNLKIYNTEKYENYVRPINNNEVPFLNDVMIKLFKASEGFIKFDIDVGSTHEFYQYDGCLYDIMLFNKHNLKRLNEVLKSPNLNIEQSGKMFSYVFSFIISLLMCGLNRLYFDNLRLSNIFVWFTDKNVIKVKKRFANATYNLESTVYFKINYINNIVVREDKPINSIGSFLSVYKDFFDDLFSSNVFNILNQELNVDLNSDDRNTQCYNALKRKYLEI